MTRKFLSAWYGTPRGQVLLAAEAEYLARAITVGCRQPILQIGALGWENHFIDCTLYRRFVIADPDGLGWGEALKVCADGRQLPFQADSLDMVVLPHSLEFAAEQHQILREVERALKPEGKLVILNFNPWSWHMRYQYYRHCGSQEPKLGRFISRAKLTDWLKLLNFEIETVTGLSYYAPAAGACGNNRRLPYWDAAYAVKAIKRRYTMVPLPQRQAKSSRLLVAGGIETATQVSKP